MSIFGDLMDSAPHVLNHESRRNLARTMLEVLGYDSYAESKVPWCGYDAPLLVALHGLTTYQPEGGYSDDLVSLAHVTHGGDKKEVDYLLNDTLAHPLWKAGKPLTKSWVGKRTGKTFTARLVNQEPAPWISKHAAGSLLLDPNDWNEFNIILGKVNAVLDQMRSDNAPSVSETCKSLAQYSQVAQALRSNVINEYVQDAYKRLNIQSDSSCLDSAKSKKLRKLATSLLTWQPSNGYSEVYAQKSLQSTWKAEKDLAGQMLCLNDPKLYLTQKYPGKHITHAQGPVPFLDPQHVYLMFAWKDIPRGYRSHVNQLRASLSMKQEL